jgi:sigma-E factor negative regulatory protein RseC
MMSAVVDHNAGMLQESATVVDVRDGMALVETRSRSACSACGGGSCGTSVVAGLFGMRRNRLALDNALGAAIGDRVTIGIPDTVLVQASLWAYLAPVTLMVIFTGLATRFGLGDLAQVLCSLIGLALGLVLVRLVTGGAGRRHEFDPVMLGIEGHGIRVEVPSPDLNLNSN